MRRRSLAIFVFVWLAALMGPLAVVRPAVAAPIVTIDEEGANDEPGQKDLTSHILDADGLPATIEVGWSWDEIRFSGNNTGDACALFDTDGDGKVNAALCVTIGGNPAQQLASSPRLYTCGDDKVDRCTSPVTQITSFSSTCSVAQTNTDPFASGAASPQDTTASCHVVLDDIDAATAALVNSCSYPSEQPNSDPSDCVLIPRDAFLRVTKIATPDEGTPFTFTLTPPGGEFATINGSGSTTFLPVRSDVPLTLAESVPAGWELTSIACDGGNPQYAPPAVEVDLVPDQQVTCTFRDTKLQPAISIDKILASNADEDGSTTVTVGDTLTYQITVSNAGNQALTGVTVSDPLLGSLTCSWPGAAGALPVGGSVVCAGSYVVTQEDANAGKIDNTATGDSDQTGPVTDDVTVEVPQGAAIEVEKAGSLDVGSDGVATPGDLIGYTFSVENTGNVTLTDVSVSDPLIASVVCADTTLDPGETTTCTGSYAITQADIDAGSVFNTGTGSGTPPTGDPVTDDGSTTVNIPSNATIAVEKSGSLDVGSDGVATPGDLIGYTFSVENTGNVTLTSVSVSDPLIASVVCADTTLDPGETTTCSGSYAITQADIDAGRVDNTGVGSGTPPSGPSVSDDGSTTVTIPQAPSIAVDKAGSLDVGSDGVATPGDLIGYTFSVENTGNVTLTSVSVSDPLIASVVCVDTTLDPGEQTTCSGSYAITQADIDAGRVDNTGVGAGTPPSGPPVTDDGSTTVTIEQLPGIDVTKSGSLDLGSDGVATPGDVITFTFTVVNSGNVTLTDVSVADPLIASVVCADTTLDPGETTTCTGSYAITQADIDAGRVDNTGIGSGTPPTGDPVSDDGSTSVLIPQAPAIEVEKSGSLDVGSDGVATPGDVIGYSFSVENTGNVTLASVSVSDPLIASVVCADTTLDPGETTTCTGSYAITQADIDAGSVFNTGTGSGTPPTGDPVTDDGSTTVSIPQDAGISVDKAGSLDVGSDGVATPGDVIGYSFSVENTGNVTLASVSVSDPLIASVVCADTTLDPGETTTCTGSYAITQADIDAGRVDNTGIGSGTPPTGDPVTDDGSTTVLIPQAPGIDVEKSGSLDVGPDGIATPGDLIGYSFTVENTGNVTLTMVSVFDPLIESVVCVDTTLDPGEQTTCAGSYAITQADIDAGRVDNTGIGSGTPPSGPSVSDDGSTTISIPQAPSIAVDKAGSLDVGSDDVAMPGDLITYTFTVENTGNVTLAGVSVSDPLLASVVCVDTTLAPGEQTTCSGSYAITQPDIDAGSVFNLGIGSGTPPSGDPVTDDGSTTVLIPQEPGLVAGKAMTAHDDLDGNGAVSEGDTLEYAVTVTNTGNVTLTSVTASDPVPAQTSFVACDPACSTDGPPVTEVGWTLEPVSPGQTATATLTVRVGRLTSCLICNTATADSDQTGPDASDEVCLSALPTPHPDEANADGAAYAVAVDLLGLGIEATPLVESRWSGVGSDVDADSLLSLAVPSAVSPLVKAGLLEVVSSATVTADPARAGDLSTAEVANLNVLNGLITADAVRAVASAGADGSGASITSLGSTFVNLKVNGVAMKNVAPNTTVNLPAALFGKGSYVRLYERIPSTSGPAAGTTFGGTYAADLMVNMIHVVVKDALPLVPGRQGADIVIASARAHADFPRTTICALSGSGVVSGHAFVAGAQVGSDLLSAIVGRVGIPSTGGADHQELSSVAIPPDGSIVDASAAESESVGFVASSGASSWSFAEVAGVCVLSSGGTCALGATLVRSQANSAAGAGGASSSPAGSQLIGLEIGGEAITLPVAPNTLIELPGIGFVVLNEQRCDSTSALPACAAGSSTGLTVRAIRVVITNPTLVGLGLGTEVIVAEAHSDAAML